MRKRSFLQRDLARATEKHAPTFTERSTQNALESTHSRPHISPRGSVENVLELAHEVCVLANAGLAAEGVSESKERVAEMVSLLWAAGWRPDDRQLRDLGLEALKQKVANALAGDESAESDPVWLYVLRDFMRRMAENLDRFIKCRDSRESFSIEFPRLYMVRVDSDTGRPCLQSVEPFGRYQNVFERALGHRKMDARRFARCANNKCGSFFYKPRLSSQACSRKCEDVLMSRMHYFREKERRMRALELENQRKDPHDIARILGVSLKRVRHYLASGRKQNNEQTKRR